MAAKSKRQRNKRKRYPSIETERLILRGFTLKDAGDVQRLAGDKAIASTTLSIPHPYKNGVAEKWIRTHRRKFEKQKEVNFAVVERKQGYLIGGIGLGINKDFENAEVGYWIGKPYWNKGYCTEAAKAVFRYGFERLGLHRIYGRYFSRNPASGRVLKKSGLRYEGCLRQHVKKGSRFEDVEIYGTVKADYQQVKRKKSVHKKK